VTVTDSRHHRTAPKRRIPGEEGTWVFLFGDMLVFFAFFVVFMVERSKEPELFDAARRTLHIGIGLTNTVVLLTSSLCVVIALGAIRARARSIATASTAIAIGCGITFIALKSIEYTSAINAGYTDSSGQFYLYYFILTGLHLLHVCIGLGLLTFILSQTRRNEVTAARMTFVEGAACFWHLVDILWIVIFSLLYLVS